MKKHKKEYCFDCNEPIKDKKKAACVRKGKTIYKCPRCKSVLIRLLTIGGSLEKRKGKKIWKTKKKS